MSWKEDIVKIMRPQPKHILFLCVANSARSQMAEGIAKSVVPRSITISSAGSHPTQVNPLAIQALSEIGIDMSSQYSKGLDAIDSKTVDVVITLCAEEVCPAFIAPAKRFHWGLPDPANDIESFRKIRNELLKRFTELFKKQI